jgi:hypothetical protein
MTSFLYPRLLPFDQVRAVAQDFGINRSVLDQEQCVNKNRKLAHPQFFLARDQGKSPSRLHKARVEGNPNQEP